MMVEVAVARAGALLWSRKKMTYRCSGSFSAGELVFSPQLVPLGLTQKSERPR